MRIFTDEYGELVTWRVALAGTAIAALTIAVAVLAFGPRPKDEAKEPTETSVPAVPPAEAAESGDDELDAWLRETEGSELLDGVDDDTKRAIMDAATSFSDEGDVASIPAAPRTENGVTVAYLRIQREEGTLYLELRHKAGSSAPWEVSELREIVNGVNDQDETPIPITDVDALARVMPGDVAKEVSRQFLASGLENADRAWTTIRGGGRGGQRHEVPDSHSGRRRRHGRSRCLLRRVIRHARALPRSHGDQGGALMGGFGRWASAHSGAIVAAIIAIAFVTAGSIARCQAIHAPADAGEQQSPETLADEELPEEAKSLRKSYTSDTREALGLLAANVWTDGSGTVAVTFTDRAIHVVTQGDEDWAAFAVRASRKKTTTDDEATSNVTTLCIETSEWTDIAMLTAPSTGDGERLATFQCPSVCGGSELTLSPALKEVSVDGPSDAYLDARGTSRPKVEATLARWCALWRPTATTATWTEVVEENHNERVCRIYYELDDRRDSKVTVVVGMDDGTLSVEEGGR